MPLLLVRLLTILCVAALLGSGAMSAAMAGMSGQQCLHEHGEHPGSQPHHHDHHETGCLACCLSACAAMPNPASPPATNPRTVRTVGTLYWVFEIPLASRSIPPDLAPPRRVA